MAKDEMTTHQTATKNPWDLSSPRGAALVAAAVVVAVVAVVAVVFGTGSADGSGALPPRSTSSGSGSPAPSGSASATGSGTPTPSGSPSPSERTVAVPIEAEERTEAGATAFLKFFIREMSEAAWTAESEPIKQISGPKCAGCKSTIRIADEFKAKEQRLAERESVALKGQKARPDSTENRYVFDALIAETASQIIDKNGAVVKKNTPSKWTMQATITWDGTQWFVEDARKVVG
ncbi:MAG: DUF6318 family protein [Phycicoccus sp.]